MIILAVLLIGNTSFCSLIWMYNISTHLHVVPYNAHWSVLKRCIICLTASNVWYMWLNYSAILVCILSALMLLCCWCINVSLWNLHISRASVPQIVEKTFQLSRADRETVQRPEYDLQVCSLLHNLSFICLNPDKNLAHFINDMMLLCHK